MNNVIDTMEKNSIEILLNDSISFLEKGYLSKKDNFEILKIKEEMEGLSFSTGIRMIHLSKFVYEEKENILDKLSNVFTSLYGNKTSIFLILDSDGEICNFYLGVRDEKAISQSISTLKASLNGNFPGIEYNDYICTEKIENLMKNILKDDVMEISTVTGIPSLKSDNKDKFLQGIEKVVDGMEGKIFSALFIANPVEYEDIKDIKRGYENLYNQLHPFVEVNVSLNKNEAIGLSETTGENFTKNYNTNLSKTDATNKNFTSGRNNSTSTGYSSGLGIIGGVVGGLLGGPIGVAIGSTIASGLGNASKNNSSGENKSETYGSSESNTYGETYGETKGYQNSLSNSKTESSGKTIQMNQKNKILENLVKKVDQHIERIESAEGNGLWNIGTYFLSEDPQNSVVAANIYNGIIRGKISGIERNTVCKFDSYNDLEIIKDYLYNFINPILKVKVQDSYILTSIGSLVTNDELALKLNFPQKSVSGLDVVKMASFGRNKKPIQDQEDVKIGNLYHLGKAFPTEIGLDIESLSSHTFITGSTGSGKSNAIYCILEKLCKNNIKFLVIEPAKGEYKNIFGGKENVHVYGTNINYTELLKVNPFSFNSQIHILEHIDRLIEIFNACWPMYAAMPAILKDAIEKAYVMLGWDLKNSKNLYGQRKFPTLKQLQFSLNKVINNSSYSEESKSNYIGALVTRVKSLENGLIGNIFSEDELNDIQLFDENVIIDISRIPSAETKSLVMGIVFMKLQEYRMSNNMNQNSKLKHVTVLEEAHNLLKRTSTEQSLEGSNLQGKSIEMITNAIAEMRTYGEGFIIADQAPGLLDDAVIRNTNTKICLRLPSKDDREIVGKAMDLNEEQINELSRLETGVAAVYQNNWNETCLVKFNYMHNKSPYKYISKNDDTFLLKNIFKILLEDKLISTNKLTNETEKNKVIEYFKNKNISQNELTPKNKDKFIFEMIGGEKILSIINSTESNNVQEWNNRLELILKNILNLSEIEKNLSLEIANSIIRENTLRNPSYLDFYKKWDEFIRKENKLW
ncbi:MAG: helicase HerA domain-containing protein [Fusobacteriaceae bacterium]